MLAPPRFLRRPTAALVAGAVVLLGALGSPGNAQGVVFPGPADTAKAGGRAGGDSEQVPSGVGSGGSLLGEPPSSGAPSGPNLGAPTGGALGTHSDLDSWVWWWEFRRDAVLRQRPGAKVHVPAPELVDQLLPQLTPTTDAAPLRAGLIAAAKCATTDDEQRRVRAVCRSLFEHPDARVVESAIVGLGLVGGQRSALTLADLLGARTAARKQLGRAATERERAFAAVALGLAAGRRDDPDLARFSVHHLASVLDRDREPELQIAALAGLGLVPLAFDEVEVLDGDERARPASASGSAQLRTLLALLERNSVDPRVLPHVTTTLGALVAEREVPRSLRRLVVEALLRGLGVRRDAALQRASALALGWIADTDEDPADKRARAALRRAADRSRDAGTRSTAWLAWIESSTRTGRRGERGDLGRLLREVVERPDKTRGQERAWANLGLGWCADRLAADGALPPRVLGERASELLAEAKSPADLASLAAAAGLAGARSARGTLLATFRESRVESVRAAAALGLGLLDDDSHASLLLEALPGVLREPSLLRECVLALARLEAQDAVPVLLEALRTTRSLPVRGSLAVALGSLEDSRSVPALLALYGDAGVAPTARAFAALALGRLGDVHSHSWRAQLAQRTAYTSAPSVLYDDSGDGLLNLL